VRKIVRNPMVPGCSISLPSEGNGSNHSVYAFIVRQAAPTLDDMVDAATNSNSNAVWVVEPQCGELAGLDLGRCRGDTSADGHGRWRQLGRARPDQAYANSSEPRQGWLKIGPLAQALPVPPCTRRERAPGTEQAGHIPSSQLLKLLVDREPLGVIALLPSGPDQAINFVVG
jgi:hypothetical protein